MLAAELAAKNKDLETIVYVVSHDLRSPLLNVQGFGNALRRACEELKQCPAIEENPRARHLFETDIARALRFIDAGVTKMDALLAGFLRFSRLGRVALQVQPLAMNKLISGIVETVKFEAEQAGAAIDLDRLPDCIGDPTLIGQVFSNLIDNAIKYREPARRCLIFITGELTAGQAIYRVRDNGIGIAPGHQPKVFELFYRLDPGKTQGEGLGLAIAQRALDRQHGRLWLESCAGEGATFFVSLPAVAAVSSDC